MQRIKRLSPLVINQIAAGEVIERPSSVIKELLENSLDAEANNIEIEVEGGGVQKIIVRDNGKGILKEDLQLSIIEHSTSKITSANDLQTVSTLGFRGEALSSICSVAKLELTSRTIEDELAYKISVNAGEVSQIERAIREQGTTVEVNDLFYNVPVRRKFLKSEKTESFHVENVIKRVLLSRFDVKFKVKFDDKVIYNFPSSLNEIQKEKRLIKIFGSEFLSQALNIDTEAVGLKLSGWVCKPQLQRRNTDWQYVYLNGRVIRDKLIQHAVKQAYSEHMDSNTQPSYVIYLVIDPSKVDVNVHPTKYEVRFQESRYVHDFIVHAVKSAIESPSLFRKSFINVSAKPSFEKSNNVTYLAHSSNSPAEPEDVITQMYNRYLLVKSGNGFIIVDLKEIFLEEVNRQLESDLSSREVKPYLIPLSFKLKTDLAIFIEKNIKVFSQLGLFFELLGDDTLVMRKSLTCYQPLDFKKMMEYLSKLSLDFSIEYSNLKQLVLNFIEKQIDENNVFFQQMEVSSLFKKLMSMGNPRKSFRNRFIWCNLTLSQIAALF